MEKVALTLVNAACYLRQYFQSHKITVQTDCPIGKILRKPELVRQMMTWSIELSKYDIAYESKFNFFPHLSFIPMSLFSPLSHFVSPLKLPL